MRPPTSVRPQASSGTTGTNRRELEAVPLTSPEAAVGVPLPENLRLLDELRLRFDDFCDYARTAQRQSPTSLAWYRQVFENWVRFLRESVALGPEAFRLATLDLEAWVRWNARRGIRPVTMNSYWRGLRAFFTDRERRDGTESPFRGRSAPRVGVIVPKAKSPEECRRILIAAENYPWPDTFAKALAVATIGTMLYAGLRRGEVYRLLRTDVQLDGGTLRVTRGKGRYEGKDRTAYIPPELDLILRDYLRARERRRVVAPELFVTDARGAPLSENSLRKIVRQVSKASGIPFSCHALRHSYVTQLLRSGVPLHIARDLAGHADIETTLGYLRVFDEDRAEEVRKVSFRRPFGRR